MNQVITSRTLRVAKAVIELYAKRGTTPRLKEIAYQAYGQYRECVRHDVMKLCRAGVLKMDPFMGYTSIRPAPEYRLPFEDETGLPADASDIVSKIAVG